MRKLYPYCQDLVCATAISVLFNFRKLQRYYDIATDSYPPLYADQRFAPWPEQDDSKNYCLISSSDGGVIRHSTSYCAWKIFELTGAFPVRKTRRRFDAKDWVEFLAEAGYTEHAEQPIPGHHYVGIIPDEGEFGQVVWYGFSGFTEYDKKDRALCSDIICLAQKLILPSEQAGTEADYFCTTYENFEFKFCKIDHTRRDVTWVEID